MNKFQKKSFSEKVIYWVKKIPKGKTASYGEIAILAGSPRAARAVGMIMKKNKNKAIPCHRVIKSDGSLGGYNGNLGKKEQLLQEEGGV